MLTAAFLAAQLLVATTSPWDAPLPDKAQVVRYATINRDTSLENLARRKPELLEPIKKDFDELAKLKDGARQSALRGAAMQIGGYGDHARMYHAHALALDPEDPIRLSNFAAMVMVWVGPDTVIPYLRLAEQKAPKEPAILVNLGNAAVTRGEHDRAQKYFDAALKLAPEDPDAWLGMGAIWLARNNYPKALEAFGKANGISYHPGAGKAIDPPPPPGQERPPPPKPLEAPKVKGDPGIGSAHVTATTLKLPPLPAWNGPDAFLHASEKRQAFRKEIGRRRNASMEAALKVLQEGYKVHRASEKAADSGGLQKLAWATDYEAEGFDRNDAWLKAEMEKIAERRKEDNKLLDRLNEQLKAATDQQSSSGASKACETGNMQSCRQMFIDWCRNLQPLTVKIFTASDDAYRREYAATTKALEEYYRAQAGWIRRVHDKYAWERLNHQRESMVWTYYSGLLMNEEVALWQTIGFAMASMGKSAESCPDVPPKKPQAVEEAPLPEVAQVPPYCPFRDGPFTLDSSRLPGLPVNASFSLSCDAVEIGVSGGLFSARYKRAFRSHTRLHFDAEVGGEAKGVKGGTLDTLGGAGTSLSGKLKGAVDVVIFDDGKVMATTQVEAKVTAKLFNAYEVKVVGGIASDHMLRGKGNPVAVDQK